MKKIISMGLMIFLGLMAAPSHASWLIYHKPEFKGKVIDAETKAPIEGAAVSVYYKVLYYDIGGGGTRVIHTKETLTDENGEFVIPSYTTLMLPLNTSANADFIIYKPGYASYPGGVFLCGFNPEFFFLNRKAGLKDKCSIDKVPITITFGLLELTSLSTKYDRLRAIPSRPSCCGAEEFPFLYKLINEERRRFGLGEVNS
jgi:hypothetical protein